MPVSAPSGPASTTPSNPVGVTALVQELGRLLRQRNWRLVTAESCTGGWIAKCCTDLPGSSDWFDRGHVTYSNDAKQEMLGVPSGVLQEQGAVSEACARAMAAGALTHSKAQVAVAVTGIAGPGGGSADKPVGLVWIAWADTSGYTEARHFYFDGDRDQVRQAAVMTALHGVLDDLAVEAEAPPEACSDSAE